VSKKPTPARINASRIWRPVVPFPARNTGDHLDDAERRFSPCQSGADLSGFKPNARRKETDRRSPRDAKESSGNLFGSRLKTCGRDQPVKWTSDVYVCKGPLFAQTRLKHNCGCDICFFLFSFRILVEINRRPVDLVETSQSWFQCSVSNIFQSWICFNFYCRVWNIIIFFCFVILIIF